MLTDDNKLTERFSKNRALVAQSFANEKGGRQSIAGRTLPVIFVSMLLITSCGRSGPNTLPQEQKPEASSTPSNSSASSRKVGTVKIALAIVDNKSYSYQTPDGESGTTDHVAFVVLADGKEVQALPYVNFKTADGAFHSELSKKGQRVELEPPLGNTELWRMVGFVENSK